LSEPSSLNEPGQPILNTFQASDGYRFFYRKYEAKPNPPAPFPEREGGTRGLGDTDSSSSDFKPACSPLLAGEGLGERLPKTRLVCIHGIQSHGGWYTRSSSQFAEAGHEVYFLDRRGSGLNSENRGDIPSFRRAIDDLAEFIQQLPTDGVPTFLLCISWGGKLGIGLQYRHPKMVQGLILVCPGIKYRVKTPFLTRLGITFSKFAQPRKEYLIPLNDPKLFTSSEKWQEFLQKDDLSLHHGTARLLSESVLLDIYLRRAKKHVHIPILLLLAERDQILDNPGVRAFVEKFPTPDKTIIEYPEAHHTLEFEPEGHAFVGDILRWIESRRDNEGRMSNDQ
jgi:alpha-beta hydrolase superfamily lysophospholipase